MGTARRSADQDPTERFKKRSHVQLPKRNRLGLALRFSRLAPKDVAIKKRAVAQRIRGLAVTLIVRELPNKIGNRLVFLRLLVVVTRQQKARLHIHQGSRHQQIFAGHVEVEFLKHVDVSDVLIRDLRDREMVDIQFVGTNQMKEKIQRTLKGTKAHQVGRRRHQSPIRARTSPIVARARSLARLWPSANTSSATPFRFSNSARRC